MALRLADFETMTRKAVGDFWMNRKKAIRAQKKRGKTDAGNRGAVTAGKNMNGFLPLIEALIRENGLPDAIVKQNERVSTLPGFFRPTKRWDYVVSYCGKLTAVIEMKSQIGSIGNNFNNRSEEAIGNAQDFWTAFREDAFGKSARPFIGYLILVEDSDETRKKVKVRPSNFDVFEIFEKTSYIDRYRILCERLVLERLYSTATIVTSPTDSLDGKYGECSEGTGMKRFVTAFAAAIAATAAECDPSR